jgi:PST family polysaccharide transporter
MTLIRTSLLNGIAVVVKMLTLLGLNKVLAIYVGPSGYAAVGQLQNAVQMITTFASGAVNTGVTKYTAEYADDIDRQYKLWRTAGCISLVGAVVASCLIAIFSGGLAVWFFKDEGYASVFLWFSVTLVFFVLNSLLLAILNGKKEISIYVIANIAGSLFAFFIALALTLFWGLHGALTALVTYQAFAFFVTLSLCMKKQWFNIFLFVGKIDKDLSKKLFKYALMALVSAGCMPVCQIFIREYLTVSLGHEAAGYWEGMLRMSSAYLLLVSTTLSVYFLPRLSELKIASDIRRELAQGYKLIIPIVGLCGLFIYFFRDALIVILFSQDFYPMRGFFLWQMIGDTLKISAWILAYLMLGKAMVKAYIFTEIGFSITYYFLVVTAVESFGLYAASTAYAINYLIYLCVLFFIICRYLRRLDGA